jgi:hypothetical protein
MRDLAIDLEDLALAMDDHDPEASWYLDLQTGEVNRWSDYEDDALDDDEIRPEMRAFVAFMRDEPEADPARFEEIPTIESHRAYDRMAAFAARCEGQDARMLLVRALAERGPFRRFRSTLEDFPELQRRWRAEHSAYLEQEAREWLEMIGVRPLPPA